MHYYIDAYNLLFRTRGKHRSLEQERFTLIHALNEQALLLRLNLTLVFDASRQLPVESTRGHMDALEIIYTAENESADDYIIDAIERTKNPKVETVVTSDRQLGQKCKLLGANTQTISQFLQWIIKKTDKTRTSSPKIFKDSRANIDRLLSIFEERLRNQEEAE